MMNKTYLELASEIVTAMVNKGYLRVVPDKADDWKAHNRKAVHTIGWALLEMYQEVQSVPMRARYAEDEKRRGPASHPAGGLRTVKSTKELPKK